MIKDEKKGKILKIVIFNVISAIMIVLCWFLLYYFFENHGWLFFSKEDNLLLDGMSSWEGKNMEVFCIVYFLIQIVNYRFTDLPFTYYAFIQAILDFAIFNVCMLFMENLSWYAPITGVDGEYTMFRALINYSHQYIAAASFSNINIWMIQKISTFVKRIKEKRDLE